MVKTLMDNRGLLGFALAAVATIALVVGACSGGNGGGGSDRLTVSCDSISNLPSYRYEISLKLASPAFERTPGSPTAAPLSAFADALTALFSDMRLEGAFVAPDRSQTILRVQGEELELRSVEGENWVRVGLDWQQSSEEASLTPAVVCTDIVERLSDSLSGAEATTETVSEIVTKHYALDDADLERLPELLGTSPETQLPDKFQVDVWVADEGRWPVRLNITSQTTDEQGRAIGLDLFMEFRDVGDPGIAIDAPLVSASDG